MRYLVKEAHVLQLPENVGTALHLPQHLTINRVLSNTLCPAFVSELRRVVSSYISNCLYCQKVLARGGKFRPYHHMLTDPWIRVKMRKFGASTTFFSRILLDNINVKVRRSQTRKSDWCNLALIFGLDCATGYFFCLLTHDLSSKSLISALQILFIKYSQPLEIITDAHAIFRSVSMNNP